MCKLVDNGMSNSLALYVKHMLVSMPSSSNISSTCNVIEIVMHIIIGWDTIMCKLVDNGMSHSLALYVKQKLVSMPSSSNISSTCKGCI
ncbi:hypothetical protein SASPL_134112 [Salvia splendens]|uniref:Uncharacterized protein n=1 Tax=Salvia splendens TaxID=180675 RepID=A0A8X8X4A6_SALSN|nr:hypothetical protein SASPL_134112 [Salvia splendens]